MIDSIFRGSNANNGVGDSKIGVGLILLMTLNDSNFGVVSFLTVDSNNGVSDSNNRVGDSNYGVSLNVT